MAQIWIRVKDTFGRVKIKGFKSKSEAETAKSPKKRNLGLIFLLCIVALVVLTGAGFKATSSSDFCISCHEMAPEKSTWEVTSHSKVACVTCHTSKGVSGYLEGKADVLSYTLKHLTGNIPEQIVTKEPIKNETCESCHSSMRKVTASGDINIPHAKHLQHEMACVACHGGVAHAFVAERGLTNKADYATWTTAKAEKVSNFDDTKTAMEVCMDCHDLVNQGQKPWIDNFGVGKTEEQRMADQQALKEAAASSNGKLPQVTYTMTGSKTGLQAPMRCAPCHTEIKTPFNHVGPEWKVVHGKDVAKDVKYCADCHSRQKERALITVNTTPKDYARSNTLCAMCHEKRPASHLESKKEWLPAHSRDVKDKGAQNCLVCHEVQKPDPKLVAKPKSGVNQLYCNTCHWFKDDKVEFKQR